MIIFPLIALPGIDDQAPQLAHHRSWTGIREFFLTKTTRSSPEAWETDKFGLVKITHW